MKFFKYSILALAAVSMATTFSACSDDDDFTPGAEVSGVYFGADEPATVEVSKNATSFDVTIGRTGTTAAATYAVTATVTNTKVDKDGNPLPVPEGLLSFPATVSFAEGASEAVYSVTVDPTKLTQEYEVSLKFGDGVTVSPYGKTDYNFTLVLAASFTEWKPFMTGTGNYIYALNFLFTGDDPGLPILYRTNLDNPNEVQLVIQHWATDMPLYINMDAETGICTVPLQPLIQKGEPILINGGDYAMYVVDLFTITGKEAYADASFFDEEEGKFYLALDYPGEDTASPGDFYSFNGGSGYEYFQLDGFASASVELEYNGMFIDKASKQYATFTVSVGEAADKALVAVSNTLDEQSLVQAIVAGTVETVEVAPCKDATVQVPFTGAGKFNAAIVSWRDGEPNQYASTSFKVKGLDGGSEGDGWKSYGTGELTDGWITARYNFDGTDGSIYTFADLPWDVQIERNTANTGLYRMVNAWSDPESLPVQTGINEDPEDAEVVIDCTNPSCVKIAPQYSGCSMAMSKGAAPSKIDIGDYSFLLGETLDDGTVVDEELLIQAGRASTLEDGIVYVPEGCCRFGFNGEFGYAWQDQNGVTFGYAVIYLGDPDAQLGTRQKAQQRAADKYAVANAMNPGRCNIRLLPEGYKVATKAEPTLAIKFKK